MIRRILLIIPVLMLIAVVAFGIVIAMQPADYRIKRTATINAAPAEVFAQVNDFHQWDAWSPFAKIDPNANVTYAGPSAGKGAVFTWAGNSDIGTGSMTILESKPGELVRIKLEFTEPMQDACTSEFIFQPKGEQTEVTWSMYGQREYLGKAICYVMDMEQMVGSKYEEGLANLKVVVEKNK